MDLPAIETSTTQVDLSQNLGDATPSSSPNVGDKSPSVGDYLNFIILFICCRMFTVKDYQSFLGTVIGVCFFIFIFLQIG